MKKLLGMLLGSILLGSILMLILGAVNWFIDWATMDEGRFILSMIIIGYVVVKMIKRELEL